MGVDFHMNRPSGFGCEWRKQTSHLGRYLRSVGQDDGGLSDGGSLGHLLSDTGKVTPPRPSFTREWNGNGAGALRSRNTVPGSSLTACPGWSLMRTQRSRSFRFLCPAAARLESGQSRERGRERQVGSRVDTSQTAFASLCLSVHLSLQSSIVDRLLGP